MVHRLRYASRKFWWLAACPRRRRFLGRSHHARRLTPAWRDACPADFAPAHAYPNGGLPLAHALLSLVEKPHSLAAGRSNRIIVMEGETKSAVSSKSRVPLRPDTCAQLVWPRAAVDQRPLIRSAPWFLKKAVEHSPHPEESWPASLHDCAVNVCCPDGRLSQVIKKVFDDKKPARLGGHGGASDLDLEAFFALPG